MTALTQALPREYNVVMAFIVPSINTQRLYVVHDGLMTGDEAIWNAANFTDFTLDGVPAVPSSIVETGPQHVALQMTDEVTEGQLASFTLVHPDSRRFPAAVVVDLVVLYFNA